MTLAWPVSLVYILPHLRLPSHVIGSWRNTDHLCQVRPRLFLVAVGEEKFPVVLRLSRSKDRTLGHWAGFRAPQDGTPAPSDNTADGDAGE